MNDVRRFEFSERYGIEHKSDGEYMYYEDCMDLIQENQQLKQRELELMAQVERLRRAIKSEHAESECYCADLATTAITCDLALCEYCKTESVLNETPQQSIAHIKAEAVRELISYMDEMRLWEYRPLDARKVVKQYADNLEKDKT